jgi:hypothetical protein
MSAIRSIKKEMLLNGTDQDRKMLNHWLFGKPYTVTIHGKRKVMFKRIKTKISTEQAYDGSPAGRENFRTDRCGGRILRPHNYHKTFR